MAEAEDSKDRMRKWGGELAWWNRGKIDLDDLVDRINADGKGGAPEAASENPNIPQEWKDGANLHETIMGNRFNFAVASATLAITAMASVNGTWIAFGIGLAGAFLISRIEETTYRSYFRLQIYRALLRHGQVDSVAEAFTKRLEGERNSIGTRVHLIGYWIARFLVLTLLALSLLMSPMPKSFFGKVGEQFVAGDQGPKGERGDQGPRGEPGAKGEPGPQGDPGPKGDKGVKGDPGEPGRPLSDGLEGDFVDPGSLPGGGK